ncbi:MAG: xanthine dehydrogenase family protein molybdopterin-binding subunit [Burkholderiales bacterium]
MKVNRVAGRAVGSPVLRKEDRRLLTGRGRFIADLQLPGMVHVAFARSNLAHARIRAIDVSRAQALPGVLAMFIAKDVELDAVPGMQNRQPLSWRNAVEHSFNIPDTPLMAAEKVRYVGEAYAIVVAQSRLIAEDAAELIAADFERLPVVGSIDEALQPGAPVIHDAHTSNVVAQFRVRKGNAQSDQFRGLRRIVRRFINHRFLAAPIECRGVVAEYDDSQDSMMIWSATQVVHWVRREVAKQLNLPEGRVRCIARDVGGGFGVKGHVYPEDVLIPWIARRLGRPVAWIEDRREHLLNSTHARDDVHDAEVVFDDDGRIHALIDDFTKDSGAYTPVGIGAPSNTISHMCGQYHIPNLDLRARIVATNKAPNAPYRGSGRPEGTFVMERLIDLVAGELGLEAAIVRMRNMIAPEQMPYSVGIPYRDGVPITYDSGDYPALLRLAIDAIGGLAAFRTEQRRACGEGRYLGLGFGCYVEGTGAGPFEGAMVRIDPSGSIIVATGACSQGQGHETVFAQVAADEWGVRPEDVTILLADTATIANGYGTIASRSAVNSSGAIVAASKVLRRKVLEIGGFLLECDVRDLELRDGAVALKGAPEHRRTLSDIARAAQAGGERPPGMSIGLEATEYFEPPTVTWAYGTHAAIIEIDPDTGVVTVRKYVVAHDAGVLINPTVANGQIMGGVCQGIGGCLLERVVYDPEGQNLTGSLMDYALPLASHMPDMDILHTETPSTLNELGVKGLGEGGAVGPPAAIINAVCDALRPIGSEWNRSFVRAEEIAAAIRQAKGLDSR